MAAAYLSFIPTLKPNPSRYSQHSRSSRTLPCASLSASSGSEAWKILRRCDFSKRGFGARIRLLNRRFPSFLPLTAHEESNRSDIEVEKASELKYKEDASQEAWKQTLESFKEEAKKMKEISQEAYDVYSKKAIAILEETSEALKIQADKTRRDLSMVAKEISQGSQVYLSTAAVNSPESVKDIVETFASAPDELNSAVRDFYVGIPYGSLLAIGGFLNFMLTGSIPAIRFGAILGSFLLALGILSLRSWRSGQPSRLFLNGQAAIATVIFIREWRLFSKIKSFPTFLMTFISGAMLAFYVYRLVIDESTHSSSLDESSDK
ncbi:protein FATTY ACID EXPORT 3, chloroplastic [Phalaenopsis equestris]|uniref:protein FATTY ACID EXPORT 3, chloroplastic n=1 Tax=Phalaenopsis equestris TaxID=78828 RepID=UPI0009E5F301|nr:protein FATTY ACID EXPORT 3, chloroplastic [Phalaenopsis equestris]XP_020575320.1 protein FATTY ACID EXPORT 3, chloroplastic [Phalaenopsis equestris]